MRTTASLGKALPSVLGEDDMAGRPHSSGSLIRLAIYAEKQFVFKRVFRMLSIPSVYRELLIQ